jgi:hypothetical protein
VCSFVAHLKLTGVSEMKMRIWIAAAGAMTLMLSGCGGEAVDIAEGVYVSDAICGAKRSGEICLNDSDLEKLCKNIAYNTDGVLISAANTYSMSGKINLSSDAIRHLVENDQVSSFRTFYDSNEKLCMISFALQGDYMGSYYSTDKMYLSAWRLRVGQIDGELSVTLVDGMGKSFYSE